MNSKFDFYLNLFIKSKLNVIFLIRSIVGAPALHRLRLDHNAISQLDDRLLENLARMTITARRQLKVYLAGNKFLCDCFLKPIQLVSFYFLKKFFNRQKITMIKM